MEIKLDKDKMRLVTEKVQCYFRDELDQPIGDLKAEMLIAFFIKELGPKIYNQAIEDANAFIQEKLLDLEGILYIPEE